MDGTLNTMVDWLATYSVHSTVLLLMAWTGDRWLRARPQVASVVWKTALVGGALTASLQVGGVVEPQLGWLHMTPETVVETPVQAASPSQPLTAPAQIVREEAPNYALVDTPHNNNNVYASTVTAAPVAGVREMTTPDAGSEVVVRAASPYNWRHVAMGIWALGGLLGLIRIARSWRGLSHQLRGRRTILGSRVRRTFDELCLAAGCPGTVRLTSTHRIDVPLAMGVTRPEICVPRRALGSALDADAQESLLAHELAHVVHRDPLWRLLGAAFEGLLFFQPLNRVANRKLGTYAEYLADEWAVSHTRQPLVLARCLTEVAGWVLAPTSHLPASAMASGKPSVLSQRVRRLLDDSPPTKRQRPLAALASLAMFAGVVFIAPGVLGASGNPAEPEKDAPTLSSTGELNNGPGPLLSFLPEGVLALPTSGSLGGRVLAAANPSPEPEVPRGAGLTTDPKLNRALRRAERRQARALKEKRRKLERLNEKAEKRQDKARAKAQKLEQKVDRAAQDLAAQQRGLSAADYERERSRAAVVAAHIRRHQHPTPPPPPKSPFQHQTPPTPPKSPFQHPTPPKSPFQHPTPATPPKSPFQHPGPPTPPHQHSHDTHHKHPTPPTPPPPGAHAQSPDRVVYRYSSGGETVAIEAEADGQLVVVAPNGQRYELDAHVPTNKPKQHNAHSHRQTRVLDAQEFERYARELEREVLRQIPDTRELERRAREIEREARRHNTIVEHEARLQRNLAREIERKVREQLPNSPEIRRRALEIQNLARHNKPAAKRKARELEAEIRRSLPNLEQLERQVEKLEREFGQKARRRARQLANELEHEARKLEHEAHQRNVAPQQVRGKAEEIKRKAMKYAEQEQRAHKKLQRKAQKRAQNALKKEAQKKAKQAKKRRREDSASSGQ